MRLLLRIALLAAIVVECNGQVQDACFAFLLRGDVVVRCEGTRAQITHRGDIDQFGVSREKSFLAYVTARITRRTPTAADARYTTTLIDLSSGSMRNVEGQSLVSTCGGLLRLYNVTRDHSGTVDLITGDEISMPPYNWFRCSSDRKIVVGTTKQSGADLYEGIPPRTKVAPDGSFFFGTFNMSPDGSKVAYYTDRHPVCLFSSPGTTQCAEESATLPDTPTVNDSGEVLVASATPQECFYKSAANFSPERFRGATDENRDGCVGVGYWKPGLKSIEIIEPLGRSPQWISPATAALLRDWSLHQTGGVH